MYDRFHPALELGSQGDDIAPVALGDNGFLQHGLRAAVADHAFQARKQTVMGDLDL